MIFSQAFRIGAKNIEAVLEHLLATPRVWRPTRGERDLHQQTRDARRVQIQRPGRRAIVDYFTAIPWVSPSVLARLRKAKANRCARVALPEGGKYLHTLPTVWSRNVNVVHPPEVDRSVELERSQLTLGHHSSERGGQRSFLRRKARHELVELRERLRHAFCTTRSDGFFESFL